MKTIQLFSLVLVLSIISSCSSEDNTEKEEDKSSDVKKETNTDLTEETTNPKYDFCACMDITLDAVEKSDSDPNNLEKFESELAPCKQTLNSFQGDPQTLMAKLKDCPDIMQRIATLSQKMDLGGFLEKSRELNPDIDKQIEEIKDDIPEE